ncbi:MAG: hypothetical protein KAR12_16170 [Methylococcales bacterium]|nr:hypothetical protein [Methylococcales bacterium]
MKHIFLVLALISTISISAPVYAEDAKENYSPFFVIPDILIYRPIGIAVTVVGAGLFAAMSPLTALAQISPPHDAFEITSNILIMGPVKYTFARPVGNISTSGF